MARADVAFVRADRAIKFGRCGAARCEREVHCLLSGVRAGGGRGERRVRAGDGERDQVNRPSDQGPCERRALCERRANYRSVAAGRHKPHRRDVWRNVGTLHRCDVRRSEGASASTSTPTSSRVLSSNRPSDSVPVTELCDTERPYCNSIAALFRPTINPEYREGWTTRTHPQTNIAIRARVVDINDVTGASLRLD